MKKKRGRPRVAKSKFKGKIINLRVTESEHKMIVGAAKREGLRLSQWLRGLVMEAAQPKRSTRSK